MPSVLLNEESINELLEKYKDFIVGPKNEYMRSLIKLKDASITIYKSNKVVFQGKDLSPFIKYIGEIENKNEEVFFNYDLYNTIGADEVGTGDCFGPIICAACFIKSNDVEELKKLGVNDSKKILDSKILSIAPTIMNNYPYIVSILNNEDFNDNQEKYNLNAMKAILHNDNLNKLSKSVNYDYVVLDQFVEKNTYYTYLENDPFYNVSFEVRGESKSIACAAASIIARYFFLKEMEKLEKEYGYKLPKGSGESADEIINKIIQDGKSNIFYHIAKKSYKNFKK